MLTDQSFRIILASKSPRRSQLLREAGLPFIVRTKEIEESYPAELPAEEVAIFLARKKSRACREFLETSDDILLTADSTVIVEEEILSKPTDRTEAQAMLRKLSDKRHVVITGVCLLTAQQEVAFGDATYVTFAPLSEAEIDYYIEQYQPYDKAGSYAIQEWIGLCKVKKIEGTFS
ncbi:MAG: septum formation protein Maf, partial [Bacteroidetes bacterium]